MRAFAVSPDFARCCLSLAMALPVAVWTADDAVADESWPIIEEYETIPDSSKSEGSLIAIPVWVATAQALSLRRDDDLTLRWNGGSGSGHETIETGWNSGTQVSIERRAPIAASSDSDGLLVRASFLAIEGGQQFLVRQDSFDVQSTLISGTIEAGSASPVIGGQTFTTFGVRYFHLDDQYDVRTSSGAIWNDYVATDNHCVMAQGRLGGQWLWKRLTFDAALAGGVGGNFGRQRGFWLDGPTLTFDESEFEICTFSEVAADTRFDLSDRTSFLVGVHALRIENVFMSRVSFAGPDDPDQATYAGFSLGIRHEF